MNHNQQAVSIFNKLAQGYQDKFMDVSLYGDTFDFFCEKIEKPNPSILEIACGPGNITKYLLNRRPDLKILGIDLAPNMIDLARINNPTATFQVMDGRAIGQLAQQFDAIMCGFFLPYLSKEETLQLIQDAAILLYPNGLFYLSTMEDDYENSTFKTGSSGDEIFMHYYRAEFLTKALEEQQFDVVKVDRKITPAPDGGEVVDLVVIGRK